MISGKDTPKPSKNFFFVVYVFVDHKSHVHYPEIEPVGGLGWTELLSTEVFLRHSGSCIILYFIRPCLTSLYSLNLEFSGFGCSVAAASVILSYDVTFLGNPFLRFRGNVTASKRRKQITQWHGVILPHNNGIHMSLQRQYYDFCFRHFHYATDPNFIYWWW
jgi:hypothetical protein